MILKKPSNDAPFQHDGTYWCWLRVSEKWEKDNALEISCTLRCRGVWIPPTPPMRNRVTMGVARFLFFVPTSKKILISAVLSPNTGLSDFSVVFELSWNTGLFPAGIKNFQGEIHCIVYFNALYWLTRLAYILAQMYSGVVISRYVFDFLPIGGGMPIARRLHILGAYWVFILWVAKRADKVLYWEK